jgi:hypothetical protein
MEGNAFEGNKLWKQTFKDAASIATDKHPKALHTECLGNNNFWRHYAATDELSIDDLAMLLCKD